MTIRFKIIKNTLSYKVKAVYFKYDIFYTLANVNTKEVQDFTDISKIQKEETNNAVKPEDIIIFDKNLQKKGV